MSPAARWTAVTIFALASTWNYLDRLVLSAAAPRVKAEFHLSNTDYGWLLSAFSLAYAFASPAVGWLLDRVGLDLGIVAAVALWSLAAALSGWSQTFGQLAAARVLLGAGESAGVPAAGKLNALYLEPKNRAVGAAMTQVGIGLAGVLAPALVAWFPGWRSPFFVCAALGLLWIPLWLLVRRLIAPWHEAPARRQPHGAGSKLLRDPRLVALALANMLWMTIYTFGSNWNTLYLTQTFGLNTAQAARYVWFPSIAATAGGFLGGAISRRAIARGATPVSARLSALSAGALGSLLILLAPLSHTPLTATLVISAGYFWCLAGSVNLYTIPVDIWGGERAGTAISALVFSYGILQAALSPAIGHLVDRVGYTPVFWILALPPGAAWLLLRVRLRRE